MKVLDDWRRDFGLLWAGSLVWQVSSTSTATALPLLALGLTGSPAFAGLVTAAGALPHVLFLVPAGLLADRLDRRRIMLVSQGVRLVVALLLGLVLLTLEQPWLGCVLLAAAVDGTCNAAYGMAELTAVRAIVPPRKQNEVLKTYEARAHVAVLLGRPLGGLLYGMNRAFPYFTDAFSSLFTALSLAFLKGDGQGFLPPNRTQDTSAQPRLKDAFAHLWHDSFLKRALVVCTTTNFLFQVVFLMLIVLAEGSELSGKHIGLLLAFSGAGGAAGSFCGHRLLKNLPPSSLVARCVSVWLALTALIAFAHQPVLGLLAWGGISFVGAALNVRLNSYQNKRVPVSLHGKVAGLLRCTTQGASALGLLAGGVLITELRSGAAWLAPGVILCLVLGHAWLGARSRAEARFRNARLTLVLASLEVLSVVDACFKGVRLTVKYVWPWARPHPKARPGQNRLSPGAGPAPSAVDPSTDVEGATAGAPGGGVLAHRIRRRASRRAPEPEEARC